MDFTTWMRQWLSGHPLRVPSEEAQERARFTDAVMQRVKAPHPAAQPVWQAAWAWLRGPQLALGLAAAAVLVAVLAQRPPASGPVAQESPSLEERALLVAALNDPTSDVLPAVDDQVLAEEWMAHDLLVLAEAGDAADEQWLEQTLQLLDQLDADVSSDGEATDEEWLDDLKLLDNAELSASS